jgi:nitroreductase
MSLMMERYSVRNFKPDNVKEEDIKTMLTSAMQAPSAVNQQPWEFVVIDDREVLKQLSTVSGGAWMLEHAPLCITVIMKDTEKSMRMRPQDCAAAVQNILLEAVNLGLGAVWIGVYPVPERVNKITEILHLKDRTPFANIAIGYPAKTKEVTVRYDESRIHRNRFE